MRILFLNPCGQMGGAETSLRELLANLRSTEPDWKLYLLLGEDGPFVDIARRLGVKVTVLPFPPAVARLGDAGGTPIAQMKSLVRATIGSALYARKLRAAYREIVPDLIHTNGFKMHILGSWTKRRKTPLVWHIHDYVSSR